MTAAGGQKADGRDTTGTNKITGGLTEPESASPGLTVLDRQTCGCQQSIMGETQ